MQALLHKREGFVVDAGVADYMSRLDVCKHYGISWLEFDRLSHDDVLKAQMYFQANSEAYAKAHPTSD